MNYFVYYAGISLPGRQREQVPAHVHPGRHHHNLQQRQVYLLVPRGARPSPGQFTEQHVCVCPKSMFYSLQTWFSKQIVGNVLGDNLGVSRNPFLSHKHKNLHEKSCLLFAMRILFLHTSLLPSLSHFLGENQTNWFVKMFYPVIKIPTFSSKNAWTNGRRVPSTRG